MLLSSLLLAHLNGYYHSANRYIKNPFLKINPEDIQDLNNLINAVDFNQFKAESHCLLSPEFNDASKLLGGAEADIVIDNKIIDIKTSRNLSITKDMFNQIMAYYILGRLGGIGEEKIDGATIEQVGFYFARYGILCLFDVKETINYKMLPEAQIMTNINFKKISDEMKEEIIESEILPNFMPKFENTVKEYIFNLCNPSWIDNIPGVFVDTEQTKKWKKERHEKSWSRRLEQLDLKFH